MKLTALSLARPVTVAMFFVCMAVVGLVSSQRLPLESLPDIEFPGIFIFVPYRNSTPEDVERRITRPVEEALATLSGIERMESESRDDGAEIRLFFDWGAQLDVKSIEARDKIDAVRDELPDDIERIQVFRFSGSDEPMLVLRISAERDLENAYDMLERNLKRRLERLEGVARVELYGVQPKEVRVELSAERVAAHGVDVRQLAQTLKAANFSFSAGDLVEGGQRWLLKPEGRFERLDSIGEMVIADNGLRLRDIAEVVHADPVRLEGRHLNDRYAVGLNIFRETGSNLVEVSRRALDEVERIKQLPEMQGVSLVLFTDQADAVKSSLAELIEAGVVGAVLSLIVLYLFLRDVRTTLIVTLAVPLALVMTLAAMFFFDYSINVLTLTGLLLAVGMLIDNAVVVTESIFRNRALGLPPREATLEGVRQVGLAVTLGTLTTAIVFLPNLFGAKNEISVFLAHVAMTICCALAASLLISITLIPQLTARQLELQAAPRAGAMQRFAERYARWLSWSIHHRGWTSLAIVLTLASVVPLFAAGLVKTDFFPQNTSQRIFMDYGINGVYALDKVEQAVNQVEAVLRENKEALEIESIYSYYALDQALTIAYLKEEEQGRTLSGDAIMEKMRPLLPKLAIGELSFQRDRGAGGRLSVEIFGDSSERLREVAAGVVPILRGIKGLSDVRLQAGPTSWEVRVQVDRERARKVGLSSQEVAEVVAGAMRGTELRPFRAADREIEMVLQFRTRDRTNLDALRALPIITASGERVTLDTVADLTIGEVPSTIERNNRRTALSIEFATDEKVTAEDARKEVEAVMKALQFPPGYSWGFGQAFDDEAENVEAMLVNMLLAIACIYLVMAALFESVLAPTSIISCILFSFVGVFWFFFLTGTTFSFMAMIGLLVLMGVVVNNGIVLIDYVHQLREQGRDRVTALIEGSRDRLRPILMTATTTVLGMVPIAVGDTAIGGDGPPYYPMARAVIGGLAFATVVSLFFLPTLYLNLEDLAEWGRRIFHRALGREVGDPVRLSPTPPSES
ncbi:MAG TPA: efflux RND transporter permease subunit [Nevskiaceae bacterium]|nr:efflux RND transporter permease subunit [Nevskiaceae bacterium]